MRLLFVPAHLQRVRFLVWLKRIHAWTGLWGAALFLLLGFSGFLLNHRTVMKIDTGGPVELSQAALPLGTAKLQDEKALGQWVKRELSLAADPRAIADPPSGGSSAKFLGKDRPLVPIWRVVFNLPNGRLTAEYPVGGTAVTVKRDTIGLLAVVKNLHKGTGLGVAWILLIDSIAGALVAMAITGFLLWSRLHGPRLLAGGLATGALAWSVAAAWPHF